MSDIAVYQPFWVLIIPSFFEESYFVGRNQSIIADWVF
jgi:hypothetical protein